MRSAHQLYVPAWKLSGDQVTDIDHLVAAALAAGLAPAPTGAHPTSSTRRSTSAKPLRPPTHHRLPAPAVSSCALHRLKYPRAMTPAPRRSPVPDTRGTCCLDPDDPTRDKGDTETATLFKQDPM